jgi:hypothetical protein
MVYKMEIEDIGFLYQNLEDLKNVFVVSILILLYVLFFGGCSVYTYSVFFPMNVVLMLFNIDIWRDVFNKK